LGGSLGTTRFGTRGSTSRITGLRCRCRRRRRGGGSDSYRSTAQHPSQSEHARSPGPRIRRWLAGVANGSTVETLPRHLPNGHKQLSLPSLVPPPSRGGRRQPPVPILAWAESGCSYRPVWRASLVALSQWLAARAGPVLARTTSEGVTGSATSSAP